MASLIRRLKGRFRRLSDPFVSKVSGGWRPGVRYVTEPADWVIDREGKALCNAINDQFPDTSVEMVESVKGLYNKVVHFGSVWVFVPNIHKVHPSNRVVLTFYHGNEGLDEVTRQAIDALRSNLQHLDKVVTASAMMEERLRSWGVDADMLHRIEIGTDTSMFHPPGPGQRRDLRRRLGIPEDALCIGSFQKDGLGWEDGDEPKLIKGPDILVETLTRLAGRHRIHVLLIGPSRGYVKRELDRSGVAYTHLYEEDFTKLPTYYHCLDLYLVTAREEGGPKAIAESLASGVPLVSTRVGMAPDMVTDGVNGFLFDVEDTGGLVSAADRLLKDEALRSHFAAKGVEVARSLDIKLLSRKLYETVYEPLLRKGPP